MKRFQHIIGRFLVAAAWAAAVLVDAATAQQTSDPVVVGTAGDDVIFGVETVDQTIDSLGGEDTVAGSRPSSTNRLLTPQEIQLFFPPVCPGDPTSGPPFPGGIFDLQRLARCFTGRLDLRSHDSIDGGPGNDRLFGGSANGDGVFTPGQDPRFDTDSLDLNLDGEADDIDGDGVADFGSFNFAISQAFASNVFTIQGCDAIDGGDGDDLISGDNGRDYSVFLSSQPRDPADPPNVHRVRLNLGHDILRGGAGDDRLIGDFVLSFSQQRNFSTVDFQMTWGSDLIEGGPGNDVIVGDRGTVDNRFETGSEQHGLVYRNVQQADDFDNLPFQLAFPIGSGFCQNTDGVILTDLSTAPSFDGDVVLDGGPGDDVVVGDVQTYRLTVTGGTGTGVADLLGSDLLLGGEGDDVLYGDIESLEVSITTFQAFDYLIKAGDDVLHGGSGDDVIYGDVGVATITDPASRLRVLGGDDTLVGGTGDDVLIGGAGSDTFVFLPGDGNDTITDYEPGVDVLDLSALGLAGDPSSLVSGTADGALIRLSGSQSVLLRGVVAGALSAADFIL